MSPETEIDIIATKVLLDAREALLALTALGKGIKDAGSRIDGLQQLITSLAGKLNGDFDAAEAAVRRFAGAITGVKTEEIKIAGNIARDMNAELAKSIALREQENRLIEQAGSKLSHVLLAKQGADDEKKQAAILAKEKELIAAREKENALIEQAGLKLQHQLQAQQKLSDEAAKKKATLPQNSIPEFVSKTFGDVNSYIAQSTNKVEAWKTVVQKSAHAAGVSFEKAGAELKKMVSGTSVQPLNNALKELGGNAESGFSKAVSAVNAFRIALGALVAMLVFQVIQAFSSMVQGALKGLTEIEAAMFNIQNAEERLSKQGFDITVTGLEKLISDLQKLDPMLSKFQATELVSSLATKVAPAIGLTEKEIASLAKSITVLAVQNQALGKSFEEVEQQVITGILSGRVTSGINQLGTKITEQRVQEEALGMRLVANAEAYAALNAREKERIDTLAIIAILEEDTAQQAENLPAFLQTASGLIGTAKAEFQDLLTTLGQQFAPVLKEIFTGIISILERINRSLVEDRESWDSVATLLTVVARATLVLAEAFWELGHAIGGAGRKLFEFLAKLPGIGTLTKVLFPDKAYADTPTGDARAFESGGADGQEQSNKKLAALKKFEDDYAKTMQDARDKRMDIERDYQRKLADIASDYSNKLQDIARNTEEKKQDAARDYAQKVEDINRDAAQAIAEAQNDFRQKELDREQEYQNKLRELREKFLFSLEDALHARDARQVLRLIRQYNLDKNNLAERHKLDKAQSKIDLAQKIEDLERERQLKLENAKREYDEKLQEIAIGERRALAEAALWHSRALSDARVWHNRQLQEQRQYLQRKLQDIAAALAKELEMNGKAAQAVIDTWNKASAGATLSGSANNIGSGGSYVPGAGGFGGTYDSLTSGAAYGGGFAEGGTLIARKPTLAMFGERGDEAVQFTPLNRQGRNINQLFGDRSGVTGGGGSLALRIGMSPGLIAEIVDTTLDNVATTIEHIRREG